MFDRVVCFTDDQSEKFEVANTIKGLLAEKLKEKGNHKPHKSSSSGSLVSKAG